MGELFFLKPVLKEMIWGGSRLKTDFSYDIPSDHTGECWAVSAHKNGDCEIADGMFKGQKLSQIFKDHKEFFGNIKMDVFPLLIKIIDAKQDLSIQVHPDDAYAKIHENGALGKTECWDILDCDQDAKIVIGHNAKTKEELEEMIANNEWGRLIREIPIKKGDFFQIEPGTVHAIKGGTLILETQQSSDVTYRLYDYNRMQNGKPRELHIKKSLDVIRCPYTARKQPQVIRPYQDALVEELVTCPYYSVNKIEVSGKADFKQDKPFTIMTVVNGDGEIDGRKIKKGDNFIIPSGYGKYELKGDLSVISSYVPQLV
ncbi:MAG: mannose-6-phosphate isomerase, class I [Lachnospiraceae bacterium]|nr:mannose-6-phosphate isomerase, class I [Lachnospiraceae bacterium]